MRGEMESGLVESASAHSCLRCPGLIQLEQTLDDAVIAQRPLPAVGGGDGRVEVAVQMIQPRRARVVEVGQGAFFQLGSKPGLATMRSG